MKLSVRQKFLYRTCANCKYLDDSKMPSCKCSCVRSNKYAQSIFVGESCSSWKENAVPQYIPHGMQQGGFQR